MFVTVESEKLSHKLWSRAGHVFGSLFVFYLLNVQIVFIQAIKRLAL